MTYGPGSVVPEIWKVGIGEVAGEIIDIWLVWWTRRDEMNGDVPSRGTLAPELKVVACPFLVKVTWRSAVGSKLMPKTLGIWGTDVRKVI
jgi:hypothetical protein